MQCKRLTIFLLIAMVLLCPFDFLSAAYNDFQATSDITVNISDLDINLTIKGGANVESMTVNSGNISITLQANSAITIESADKKKMTASGFTNSSLVCTNTDVSKMILTAADTSETGTITPYAEVYCVTQTTGNTNTGSGGGGGGGWVAPTVITPSDASISIQSSAVETAVESVELTLGATNATEMMISNSASFAGASWEIYGTTKTWSLGTGLGKKTVYAKFKSSTGNESPVVSDDIMLLPAKAVQAITASAGGKVGLSDNLVAVEVPASAVAKNTNITITPTSVFTAPTGKTKNVGTQVYEFKAEADGAGVKTFSKDLTLTFKYTADDIKGLSEKTLAVYYWDEALAKWVKVGGTVDATTKMVTAKVNHFTLFALFGEEGVVGGELVKLKCDSTNKSICTAVYYIGNDGKRYIFPTEKTFYTWYTDFSGVKEISATELAAYKIGGNITYRPGVKMVKITTDPKVYVITKGGILREIASETVAKALFGATWNKQVDDLPDPFFINYTIGKKVGAASEYVLDTEKAASVSVNVDKGL
ncbi:MAG: hypothetical protein WC459_00415 [Patescibacteria group bacterium]